MRYNKTIDETTMQSQGCQRPNRKRLGTTQPGGTFEMSAISDGDTAGSFASRPLSTTDTEGRFAIKPISTIDSNTAERF